MKITDKVKSSVSLLSLSICLPLAVAVTPVYAKPTGVPQHKQPNILFVLVDNLGYGELGSYGGGETRGAPTPRLDELARQGTRFTNMNAEAQSTPSRSATLTGRFAIRSGTYAVPFGGQASGLTRWEVTMGEALSDAGYSTSYYGKWHLGDQQGRFPNDQGFDEWYGIPRTTDEAMWPDDPQFSTKYMPTEKIMEGKKGQKSVEVKEYNLKERRIIDAEITRRSIKAMEKSVKENKPFFVFAAMTQCHIPTLPNPDFAGKTGNGPWADMLAEMDYNMGQMLDTIDKLGVRDNTIVIFLSDNGPEYIQPWDGWSGPWRGQYFTALEGGIRVPFFIRWPGKIPADRVTNEIVHNVDLLPTIAKITNAKVPNDRPIDGKDMSPFFLGQTKESGRDGFPIWVNNRLQAVKWKHFKAHFYNQDTMISAPEKWAVPHIFDLYTNPKEEESKITVNTWIFGPIMKMVGEFEESVKKYPLIPMGTPEPYNPKNNL